MLLHEGNLKTGKVKQASYKKANSVGFHFCDVSRDMKFRETKVEQLG